MIDDATVYAHEYQDQEGTHYLYPDTQRIDLPPIISKNSRYTSGQRCSPPITKSVISWKGYPPIGLLGRKTASTFLQLPEGTYELRVRKYVTRGPFPEITMQITVRPPWYNTVWAYLIYVAFDMVRHSRRASVPFGKKFGEKEQESWEAERQSRTAKRFNK